MAENTISLSISIPTDDDGYVLLQCPKCGEYFKLTLADCKSDDIFQIWCPYCGLVSESYFTDEVKELASTMVKNLAIDLIYTEMKTFERQLNSKYLSFKAGKKPERDPELPIVSKIDTLEIQTYKCCNKSAKITPSAKIIGTYCPFCGVMNFGD